MTETVRTTQAEDEESQEAQLYRCTLELEVTATSPAEAQQYARDDFEDPNLDIQFDVEPLGYT